MKISRVAGIAIAAGFVGFVAYSLLYSEPVKVLHPQLLHSKDGVFVSGAVENTGPDNESVRLEIKYYDQGGHQVASDVITLDRVGSGATLNFSTVPRALPPPVSYTIYLNHGRNPYGN